MTAFQRYWDIAFTPAVKAQQVVHGSRDNYDKLATEWPAPEQLGQEEIAFLSAADSFYLSSVSETGWPYVQHRGGPKGFVKVIDQETIGWIERTGNRQYVSGGNLDKDGRVSIIVMDYALRRRIKLFGHASYHTDPDSDLQAALGGEAFRVDGAITVKLDAFEWNCPKYITPRYTAEDVNNATAALHAQVKDLQQQLAER